MAETITARDGTALRLHEWLVDDHRITVALLHGYAEHCARYQHVAEAWNARGIQIVGCDLRGHGHSPGRRGYVERFDDYHRDVDALMDRVRERAKNKPIALFGHSMGGLLLLHWLVGGNGRDAAGAIVSSPYLGLAVKAPAVKLAAGRLISRILPKVGLPSGLSGKDVCADESIQKQYDEDPLVFPTANARWFTESTSAQEVVLARAAELQTPLLLLYGGEDKVADADATDRFAAKLTVEDRIVERLAGHQHEIVNEGPPAREKIINRMADWLLEHAETKAAA